MDAEQQRIEREVLECQELSDRTKVVALCWMRLSEQERSDAYKHIAVMLRVPISEVAFALRALRRIFTRLGPSGPSPLETKAAPPFWRTGTWVRLFHARFGGDLGKIRIVLATDPAAGRVYLVSLRRARGELSRLTQCASTHPINIEPVHPQLAAVELSPLGIPEGQLWKDREGRCVVLEPDRHETGRYRTRVCLRWQETGRNSLRPLAAFLDEFRPELPELSGELARYFGTPPPQENPC